jgi:hypothetical protein
LTQDGGFEIVLSSDFFELGSGGMAEVFTHELIHVRDYRNYFINSETEFYRYRQKNESEVRAYDFTWKYRAHFGLTPEGEKYNRDQRMNYCIQPGVNC